MPTALTGRAGRLPEELTSFVGRRRELAEVRRLFKDGPLVTLTGPGGVGKTRLALRAARELERSFRDGVWLVELAEVTDPAGAERAILRTLDVMDLSGTPDAEQLVNHLADRHALVVLDNCEHLVGAVAVVVDRLLRHCPDLRLLATSREALAIQGEHRLEVLPLEVVAGGDAVSLFAERAATAINGVGVTEADHHGVEQIVTQLDGLPLAIELAAARLRAMSVGELAERLSDRYRLLTQGSRVAPGRHQTLRLCVEWSYQQCTVQEQLLWGRLSVFVGGFEIDGVEGVAGFGELPVDDVLDVLSSLVSKSVVTRDDVSDRARFRLLESIREYGRERLADRGELDAVEERHRVWYADLVRRAFAEPFSADQPAWFQRLDRERSNLMAALHATRVLADGEGSRAVDLGELVNALRAYWSCRGALAEGRRWIDAALTQLDQPSRLRVELRVQWVVMNLAVPASSSQMLELAQLDASTLGDRESQAMVDFARGRMALIAGDRPRAAVILEGCMPGLRALGDLVYVVSALQTLITCQALLGRFDEARAAYEEGLRLVAYTGECHFVGFLHQDMARAEILRGDFAAARVLMTESTRLHARVGCRPGFAWGPRLLAQVEGASGNHERATVCGAVFDRFIHDQGFPPESELWVRVHREREDTARRALGTRAFDAAYRRGWEMEFDEVVAFVPDEDEQAAPGGAGPSVLTARETEVAELVAEGLSNKEIAGRLFISQRTVRGHLESVMVKLGAGNRAQVAAWVVGRERS